MVKIYQKPTLTLTIKQKPKSTVQKKYNKSESEKPCHLHKI